MSDTAAPAGDGAVGGPSYPLSYRIAATLALVALALSAWRLREALLALPWGGEARVFAATAVALVLAGYGHLMGSRTVVGGDAIEHGWLWTDRVPWRDVSQVQLLYWPALAWLIAPRLMLRARGRQRLRIPVADPAALRRVRAMVFGPPAD